MPDGYSSARVFPCDCRRMETRLDIPADTLPNIYRSARRNDKESSPVSGMMRSTCAIISIRPHQFHKFKVSETIRRNLTCRDKQGSSLPFDLPLILGWKEEIFCIALPRIPDDINTRLWSHPRTDPNIRSNPALRDMSAAAESNPPSLSIGEH